MELGQERKTFQLWIRGQCAELDQGGVDVEQAGGFRAGFSRVDARSGNEKRNSRGLFPEGALGPVLFFAEMEAMVAPEHHESVARMGTGAEGCQQDADAMVDETYRGQIGLGESGLLAVGNDLRVGGGGSIFVDTEEVCREILQIRLLSLWESQGLGLIKGKPPWRDEEGDVGSKKSDRHEEWFGEVLLKNFARLLRELKIGHFLIFQRVGTPVPGAAPVGGTVHRFGGPGTLLPAERAVDVVCDPSSEAVMEHFSPGHGQVAVVLEVALDSGNVPESRQNLISWAKFVAPVSGRRYPGQDADPGW